MPLYLYAVSDSAKNCFNYQLVCVVLLSRLLLLLLLHSNYSHEAARLRFVSSYCMAWVTQSHRIRELLARANI